MNCQIEELRNGDHTTFNQIVTAWYPKLVSFIRQYVYETEVAREITQDIFLKLWEKKETLATDTILTAYLFTLAKNMSLNYIKHRKLEICCNEIHQNEYLYLLTNEYALGSDTFNDVINNELLQVIEVSIDRLPEHCRRIFRMSRMEGMKYEEIADDLHISVKTVEFHMSRALLLMKKYLSEQGFTPFVLYMLLAEYPLC